MLSHHNGDARSTGEAMTDRQTIERRLKIKEKEIQQLEDALQEARGYARALRELLSTSRTSSVDMARDIIRSKGHAVHITELLEAMGREVTRESRVSLTGALSAYARRGEIFTRQGPNRFGLVEQSQHVVDRKPVPPDDFGQLVEPKESDTDT